VLAAVVLLIGGVWTSGSNRASWISLAPGVELRQCTIATADFEDAPVVAIRCSPNRVHVIGSGRAAPLDAAGWLTRARGIAAINGGFFDPLSRPLGLLVSGGRRISRFRHVPQGVFSVASNRSAIQHCRDVSPDEITSMSEAIECGPVLVDAGVPARVKPQRARRSGIGIDRQGRVIVAVADGPVSLPEWAAFWASKQGLACRNALNLDGGPSTQMAVRSSSQYIDVRGGWPVPDAIVVK